MSTFVLQIIIKQWDKSQRSDQHNADRAAQSDRQALARETAFYAFDKRCVIDQQGDDLMGSRIKYSQIDDNTVKIDRFNISLADKTLEYSSQTDGESEAHSLGSLDDSFIQCKYEWRYKVYEGGLYYWLYEEVILNAINVVSLEQDVFLKKEPKIFAFSEL